MATNNEMIDEIIELTDYEKKELDTKSKKELTDLLNKAKKASLELDSVIEEKQDSGGKEVPLMTSPKWTEYVLSLFDPKREIEKGNPKVDGLRRVAELILGPSNSITDVIQAPTVDNAGRSTVMVRVEFVNTGQIVCGAADVYSGNTSRDFANHAVATAETRAEGRALKKALKLTKVYSAEEMAGAEPTEPTGEDGRIVSGMLNGLVVMCDRAGIDPTKLALHLGYNIHSLDELTRVQGLEMSNILAKFTRKELETPKEVIK